MKKALLASVAFFISASPALADHSDRHKPAKQEVSYVQSEKLIKLAQLGIPRLIPHSGTGACNGYKGPSDIDSNFTHFWALRSISASGCGGNLINIVRADAGTGTCNGVGGQSNCDIKSLTSGAGAGNLDGTGISTFCSGSTCNIHIVYDQIGTVNVDDQSTSSNRPALTPNCINTSLYCATFAVGNKLASTPNMTIADGSTVHFVSEETSTNSGNRSVQVGQTLFNSSGGYGPDDHPDCLEGGSGEIHGATSIGSWGREICTLAGASSNLRDNGTNHTGTLTSGSANVQAFAGSGGNFIGHWVESGVNSTTMSTTEGTLDSQITTNWGI